MAKKKERGVDSGVSVAYNYWFEKFKFNWFFLSELSRQAPLLIYGVKFGDKDFFIKIYWTFLGGDLFRGILGNFL